MLPRMVKILDLSEHMGLRTAGLLQGISRIHPGYIGLRAGPVTLISGDDEERMIAPHFLALGEATILVKTSDSF